MSHAAQALYAYSWSYAADNGKDGDLAIDDVIDLRALLSIEDDTAVEELLDVGLWKAMEDGYYIVGYLDVNPTVADLKHKSRVRSEAGRTGGLRSGEVRRTPPEANASAKGSSGGSASGTGNGKPPAEAPGKHVTERNETVRNDTAAATAHVREAGNGHDPTVLKVMNLFPEWKYSEIRYEEMAAAITGFAEGVVLTQAERVASDYRSRGQPIYQPPRLLKRVLCDIMPSTTSAAATPVPDVEAARWERNARDPTMLRHAKKAETMANRRTNGGVDAARQQSTGGASAQAPGETGRVVPEAPERDHP